MTASIPEILTLLEDAFADLPKDNLAAYDEIVHWNVCNT